MGTWNAEPFGNDTAMDWLLKLESSQDFHQFINRTIGVTATEIENQSEACEEAIAACNLIAASATNPIGKIKKDAKDFLKTKEFVPSKEMISNAIICGQRILTKSELKNLWEETPSFKKWESNCIKLISRLKRAQLEGQPIRRAKKKAIPRALDKLMELYSNDPNLAIKERIHEKIENLTDVNSISKESNNELPLRLTARFGLEEETQLLLRLGADPNVYWGRSGYLSSPLTLACECGHLQVAKLLINHGAKLQKEVDCEFRDQTGEVQLSGEKRICCPPLDRAAHSGNIELFDLVLTTVGDDYLKLISEMGNGLLHTACLAGNTKMVEHLISLGLEINSVTLWDNRTPIYCATFENKDKTDLFEVLLSNGANPNIQENNFNYTVLDRVNKEEYPELYSLIQKHGGVSSSESTQ